MILINLLPHREAARKRRKEAYQFAMGVSFVVGLLIAGAIYTWFQGMIETQRAYEMNSKAISTTDSMLGYLNNNV